MRKHCLPHLTILALAAASAIPDFSSLAAESPAYETQQFTVDGKEMSFVTVPEKSVVISKSCLRGGKDLKCEAFRKLKSASLKGLGNELNGGANPGAVVCMHIGGTVVMGLTAKQDENTFCRFKDGSMVSNGSLHYHAMENDDHRVRHQ